MRPRISLIVYCCNSIDDRTLPRRKAERVVAAPWYANVPPRAPCDDNSALPTPRGNRQRLGNYPAMPIPGGPLPPRLPVEDSYLEPSSAYTLEASTCRARPFLQRYNFSRPSPFGSTGNSVHPVCGTKCFRAVRELSENLGRPVAPQNPRFEWMFSLPAGLLSRFRLSYEYDELKTPAIESVTDP